MSEHETHEVVVSICGPVPDWCRYEIVRCRDCAYNAKDTDGICYRFAHEHFNQPDGFCAWGERRERESAEVWNQWSAYDVTCSEES